MNKKYIIANWKNHPDSWAEAEQILDFVNDHLESRNFSTIRQDLDNQVLPGIVLCPPFVFLEEVGKVLKTSHLEHEAELGAQDIAVEDSSALTGFGVGSRALAGNSGEVSGSMLQKLDIRYVIVGHSERRWKLGESDETVNKKLKAVLRNGMTPVVCIGEKIRDDNFKEFLREQAEKTFAGLSSDDLGKCMIAYEPVWAISTNPDARPDSPESAIESITVIGETLIENWKLKTENLPLFLYGGSITSKNVADFVGQKEIDGVLVGGASVNKEEFVKILSMVK